MADRPIIFSAPMVRALLDGRKTQTRRVLTPQPVSSDFRNTTPETARWVFDRERTGWWILDGRKVGPFKPDFNVGDRLWVRESAKRSPDIWVYTADGEEVGWPARQSLAGRKNDTCSSIHLPRSASRLTLAVTDVRVERLNDISEANAEAEGVAQYASSTKLYRAFEPEKKGWYRHGFFALWDQIHGPEFTDANPWVAAIGFTVHRTNIDALLTSEAAA